MSDVVIDSSVVAKWVLPEPDSSQAQQIMLDAAATGGQLVVLDLAYAEVASAIWKRHRQKLITLAEAESSLTALMRCPVVVQPSRDLLPEALALAVRYDRAVYDALFVALVQKRGSRGVTADAPLFNAVTAAVPQLKLLRDWS
jgi:predicted nucleic acid-binding protein